jgi:Fur family transcriptional regulator, ferric uptake regulator
MMKTSSVDQIIIDLLAQSQCHCSSQQIFDTIKSRLPAVNRSTVYRSLDRLANQGKISVSDIGAGSLVYECINNGLHHHLVCQQCHHIIEISNDEIARLFSAIEKESQFQIVTNHLILYGICPQCQVDHE